MANIGRSLRTLNDEIKKTQNTITNTRNEVRQLDNQLKLNPGNVDAVRQKYALLSQNLQNNTQKLTQLQQKQNLLTQAYENGEISQNSYNRQLASTKDQINATEKEITELTAALNGQNNAIRQAKFSGLISGLDSAERKAKALSKAAAVAAGALAALFISAVKTGDELADTATHFGTTAENLQIWENRLGMLAKDQEAYTTSLERIGSIQSSITAGRGARYLSFLSQLGIAQEDLNNKSNGEVFDMIYNALRGVTDETERATIAQGLFGDTGLEIAVIAGTAQETLNNLDSTLMENGIITTEQAKAADEAANKMLTLKQQFQAQSAELMVSLMPAFETFVNILKTALIPVITQVANFFGGLNTGEQRMLITTLAVILILPKLITLIKSGVSVMKLISAATHAQTAAQMGLNAASAPWLPILLAIAAALLLVISIINMFIGRANEATNSSYEMLASLNDVNDKMNEMGGDVQYNANATYESGSKKELDVNVNVKAEGDGTPINQENADNIGASLRDILNEQLGEVGR